MTIRGMQTLLSLRQAGKRPALVFLDLIDAYRAPRYPHELERLTLCPEGATRNDDLRPLVGLDVVIMARDWTADLSGLYDRLTQYANEIILLVDSFGDDVGWSWMKKYGRVELSERPWVFQYRDAQADATMYACRKENAESKAGYQKSQDREREAIRMVPWLKTGGRIGTSHL